MAFSDMGTDHPLGGESGLETDPISDSLPPDLIVCYGDCELESDDDDRAVSVPPDWDDDSESKEVPARQGCAEPHDSPLASLADRAGDLVTESVDDTGAAVGRWLAETAITVACPHMAALVKVCDLGMQFVTALKALDSTDGISIEFPLPVPDFPGGFSASVRMDLSEGPENPTTFTSLSISPPGPLYGIFAIDKARLHDRPGQPGADAEAEPNSPDARERVQTWRYGRASATCEAAEAAVLQLLQEQQPETDYRRLLLVCDPAYTSCIWVSTYKPPSRRRGR